MSAPYNPIKLQNDTLKKFLSGINDYYSLERNQFMRKSERLPILGYIQYGLILLYVIVYIVLLIVLITKANSLKIYYKIGFAVLFALYPFFIYSAENAFYQIYYYIYAVLHGESYHTIMMRKGLQNPKNFKDVTNMTYYMSNFASNSRNYIMELRDKIIQLPDILHPIFLDFQQILITIPDNIQQYLVVLNNDIISLYEDLNQKISSLTNINDIISEITKFTNNINTKTQEFWNNISNLNLSDEMKNILEKAILNLKLKLNIQLSLEQLPNIFQSLYTEFQKSLAVTSDNAQQQLLTVYSDMITLYNNTKTNISGLTNTNDIKTEITNFTNNIKTKTQDFWNNVNGLNISNHDKVIIKNNINNLKTQLNIQISLQELEKKSENASGNNIQQKYDELYNLIMTSISDQNDELLKNQYIKYENDEIDKIIISYVDTIDEYISGFLNYIKDSNESTEIKHNIKTGTAKLFCIFTYYNILLYIDYFTNQIRNTNAINEDYKDMLIGLLFLFEKEIIININIETVNTDTEINNLIQTFITSINNIVARLKQNVTDNFSYVKDGVDLSYKVKIFLKTAIDIKSEKIKNFLTYQQKIYTDNLII